MSKIVVDKSVSLKIEEIGCFCTQDLSCKSAGQVLMELIVNLNLLL